MAQLTVQGSGVTDNRIANSVPTTNNGTDTNLAVGESASGVDVERSLVKFDISSIPAGSTISSATITLTVSFDDSSNARTIHVYRVKRVWTEAGSTWNKYDASNNWGTAGCSDTTNDREAADIGSAAQAASPAVDSTLDIVLTASKIQEMIAGGSFTNNGFLLQVDTEADDQIGYYATDSGSATKRPKLVVNYTSGGGGSFLYNFV